MGMHRWGAGATEWLDGALMPGVPRWGLVAIAEGVARLAWPALRLAMPTSLWIGGCVSGLFCVLPRLWLFERLNHWVGADLVAIEVLRGFVRFFGAGLVPPRVIRPTFCPCPAILPRHAAAPNPRHSTPSLAQWVGSDDLACLRRQPSSPPKAGRVRRRLFGRPALPVLPLASGAFPLSRQKAFGRVSPVRLSCCTMPRLNAL